MEYIACTFYINKERNSWVWHFNVTKKLDALIQVLQIPLMLLQFFSSNTFFFQQVKKEHKIWEDLSYISFQFCEHELLLDLKEYNEKGWSILPNMYPCKVILNLLLLISA